MAEKIKGQGKNMAKDKKRSFEACNTMPFQLE